MTRPRIEYEPKPGLPADDAITNAKLANMAANTVKGRATAGAGDPEDITMAGDVTQAGSTFTVVPASQTAAGKVELATAAEINTGTDGTRAMPVDQFVASSRNVRFVLIRVLAAATANAVALKVGGDFEFPFTGTITEIGAFVDTAGVTGLETIDVNLGGTTLMATTKITLDSAEKSSRTAATPPVLTTTAIVAGDILTVDVDAIQTTAALGLTIRIGVRQT